MYCPKCGYPHGEIHRSCVHCGAGLQPDTEKIPLPREPKGSHRIPVLILIVLSLLGILAFFALPGGQTVTAESDTPWFTLRQGALYFDESLYTGPEELTVPGEIGGEPVLYLSDGCFAWCDDLTAVILPDTLQSIGRYAFMECSSLRGIQIPSSVYDIGEGAFESCTALEAIYISDTMEQIGFGAFDNCNKLFYIFYTGSIDEWDALYGEYINPYTGVYCEDGSFYQGGSPFE